jgi:ABC-type multidrug transport system ATPase subunit/ABC-type multidrug transport system permease subunit
MQSHPSSASTLTTIGEAPSSPGEDFPGLCWRNVFLAVPTRKPQAAKRHIPMFVPTALATSAQIRQITPAADALQLELHMQQATDAVSVPIAESREPTPPTGVPTSTSLTLTPPSNLALAPTASHQPFLTILSNVSGHCEPGCMMALMGLSGSGKTTLLNVLADRVATGVVAGEVPTTLIRSVGAYVTQHDLMYTSLTAREHLTYVARLKGLHDIDARVDMTLEDLGLVDVQHNLIKTLSGGQKKRVAVGAELLDPRISILLLDESTSSLDSMSAFHLMELVRRICKKRRMIVIASIHQPSWDLLRLFDKLLLLYAGTTKYHGSIDGILDYVASVDKAVPKFVNPADWVIQVSPELPNYDATDAGQIEALNECMGVTTTRPLKGASMKEKMMVLSSRNLKFSAREPFVFRTRLISNFFIALVAGLIFLDLGYDQSSIQNRNGLLFFATIHSLMAGLSAVIFVFPKFKHIFVAEYQAGLYEPGDYFLSTIVSELPLQLFFPFLFSVVVYWMTNLQRDFGRFVIFVLVIWAETQASAALGYVLSSAASTPDIATALIPLATIPNLAFSGYFLNIKSVPPWFVPLKYLSIVMYSFSGVVHNEFSGLKFYCASDEVVNNVCPYTNGEEVISRLNVEFGIVSSIILLLVLAIGFRILAYFFLWWSVRGKRGHSRSVRRVPVEWFIKRMEPLGGGQPHHHMHRVIAMQAEQSGHVNNSSAPDGVPASV